MNQQQLNENQIIKTNKLQIIFEKLETTKQKLINFIDCSMIILQQYSTSFFDSQFDSSEYSTIDEKYKACEDYFNKLEEARERNNQVSDSIELLQKRIHEFQNQLNVLYNESKIDKQILNQLTNQTVQTLKQLEDEMMENEIKTNVNQREEIVEKYEEKKSKWGQCSIRTNEFIEETQMTNQRYSIVSDIITKNEMIRLEDWTGMKVDSILFDSNLNTSKKRSSLFHQSVFEKEHLIFLIEDHRSNMFGGYISSKINQYIENMTISNDFVVTNDGIIQNSKGKIHDSKAFVFSLRKESTNDCKSSFIESDYNSFYNNSNYINTSENYIQNSQYEISEDIENNNQNNVIKTKKNKTKRTMIRFTINQPENAFSLFDNSHENLFVIGEGDICIKKQFDKIKSYCSQWSFDYNSIPNALCSESQFYPKRIVVIQLK